LSWSSAASESNLEVLDLSENDLVELEELLPFNNWLVLWNMAEIFHFIYGMSSFPLTNSYFSEGLRNHQPDKWVKRGDVANCGSGKCEDS